MITAILSWLMFATWTLVLSSLLIVNTGDTAFVDRIFHSNGTASENLLLKLYTSSTTPAKGDTAGTYTEATGSWYASKTLTNTSWGAATVVSNQGNTTYAAQTWTNNTATSVTITGYFWVGATSGTLYGAELLANSVTLNQGSSLTITPSFNGN